MQKRGNQESLDGWTVVFVSGAGCVRLQRDVPALLGTHMAGTQRPCCQDQRFWSSRQGGAA